MASSRRPDGPVRDEYYTPIWRSPLVLGTAAGLIVLSAIVAILYLQVRARNEQKEFDAAVTELADGQYAPALKRFDKFLEDHPSGELADKARIWRGIAAVRQFSDVSSPQWEQADEQARQFIEQSASSPFYRERKKEVAELLLKIAGGLATLAQRDADPALLARSAKNLDQVEKEFQRDEVPAERVAEIRGKMKEASFAIEKNDRKLAAIRAMDVALAAKQPTLVFAEHQRLYHRYADLRQNPECQQRRAKARALELEQVRFEANSPRLESVSPAEPPPAFHVVRRQAAADAKDASQTYAVPVGDSLYGVNAGNGQPRWRRVVGFEAAFPPAAVGENQLLVHVPKDNSVALLDRASGKTIWQRRLGFALRAGSRPAVSTNRIYLIGKKATPPNVGRLVEIDLANGEAVGEFLFPQPLVASPVLDRQRGTVLALGEQASLYVLNPVERKCERVLALDHAPDAIRSPPVLAGRFLFVAECQGLDQTQLRCLVLSPSDGSDQQRQVVQFPGWVWYPPVAAGNRLFVSATRGFFEVLEMGAEQDEKPLTEVARSPEALSSDKDQDYPLVGGENDFWLVGNRLRRFDIKVGSQALARWEMPLEGRVITPPEIAGGLVLTAVQSAGDATILVRGVDPKSQSVRWTTELGLKASAVLSRDANQVAILFPGQTVTAPWSAVRSGGQKEVAPPPLAPGARPETFPPMRTLPVDKGSAVLWSPRDNGRLLYAADGGAQKAVRFQGVLDHPPVAFGAGILLASRTGTLSWIDPRTSAELAEPFVAPFSDGKPAPLGPVAVVDSKTVLVGAEKALVRLELAQSPFPYFRETARGAPGTEAIQEMTVSGALVAARAGSTFMIQGTERLETKAKVRVPFRVQHWWFGNAWLVVAGGRGDCAAFHIDPPEPKATWSKRLESEPLALYSHTADAISILLADGRLFVLRLKDGSETAKMSLGQTLAGGPWPLPNGWVALNTDGGLATWPLEPEAKK